jgi:hypothetical protein
MSGPRRTRSSSNVHIVTGGRYFPNSLPKLTRYEFKPVNAPELQVSNYSVI